MIVSYKVRIKDNAKVAKRGGWLNHRFLDYYGVIKRVGWFNSTSTLPLEVNKAVLRRREY